MMGCPRPGRLSCTAEGAITRGVQVAEVKVGGSRGDSSITYRRWAGRGAERGALEAWGCPALPAFADRFARRSCCEVCFSGYSLMRQERELWRPPKLYLYKVRPKWKKNSIS